MGLRHWIGARLGAYLSQRRHRHDIAAPVGADSLRANLKRGDVLLVEGDTRVSDAIKYLTQSTWSHAALYVGPMPPARAHERADACFVEADISEGVRAVGVDEFAGLHCRICRPIGLDEESVDRLTRFAIERIGHQYDLKNVVDLARYLIPTPPVPVRWRRRLIALGSGDPTRAICSTLIAQAFQSIRYPILPIRSQIASNDPFCPLCVEEVLRVRHHTLFVPRDFDVSPYFQIVKPSLAPDFDFRRLAWAEAPAGSPV